MNEITDQRQIIIVGAGGHALSVANVAIAGGHRVAYFIDAKQAGKRILETDVVANLSEIPDFTQYGFAIAIGDNSAREKVYQELAINHPDLYFPTLAHPTASVGCSTTIGFGTVLMPGVVVGPSSKIGIFCVLNTRSSIDHDSIMSDYSSLAPGAITGGKVTIGARTAISIGAVVKHAVAIGNDSVIGANSYINTNIASNTVAYGTPARVIRTRRSDDPYLH